MTNVLEQVIDPNSTSAKARARAAQLETEADEKEFADEEALHAIIGQLQTRSTLVRECAELERFAAIDEGEAAREALNELIAWLTQMAVGGKQRFDAAAVAYAGRLMLRPHIATAVAERRQRISVIDSEVVGLAKSHGLDFQKIVAFVSKQIGRPLSELVPAK